MPLTHRNKLLPILMALITAMLLPLYCASADNAVEYKLKAGFVFNFLKFTTFASSPSEYSVCVAGSDTALKIFSLLRKKKLSGGAIKVREVSSSADAAGCTALFVAQDSPLTAQLLNALRGKAVLTIGDTEDFIDDGGMIRFFIEGKRLRFEINVERAKSAGLNISSKVLRLAKIADK